MIKNIYVFKDLTINAFGVPRFTNEQPAQFTQGLKRGILKGFDLKDIVQFSHQELCYLGTYDDDSAQFELLPPQLLLVCDEVIEERKRLEKEAHEVSKDGE